MIKRAKISVIGAGFVGSTTAQLIAMKELGDVVLLDRDADIAMGKALDIFQALPVIGSSVSIQGTASYKDTKNSSVVVITAGVARKPGMSRDELLQINSGIVKQVVSDVVKYSPKSILIVVTNPLDAMVYVAWKVSKLQPERVIGMAGVLDSARMRLFIAKELDVSASDVTAIVLGGHGDTMIPLMRLANVNGVPVTSLLPKRKIEKIVDRTRNGGAEIVNYLKTGSAYFAPAASIAQMVESIVFNQRRLLPCAAYVKGEYSAKNVFIGVPALLGSKGVEKIIEIPLNSQEKKAFQKTVMHVKSLVQSL